MTKPLFPDVHVGDVTIPSAAIAAEAQNHTAPRGKPGLAWKAAARALVFRELMLSEAARRGIGAAPDVDQEGRRETEETAILRALLDDAVTVAVPTLDDARAIWAADPDRFRSPPLWQVSHILIEGDDAADRARDIAAKLLDQPASFAALAKEVSDCPSAKSGGFLGQVAAGQTAPEFEAALRSLKAGEVTPEPVQTRFGWHVIRLDDLAEGRPLPFDAVAPRILDALEKRRWTKAVRDFGESLLDGVVVTGIDMSNGGTPQEAEA